ncbi:MAG: hypothetical protein ACP5QK_06330 [Myxococcota bacterium]
MCSRVIKFIIILPILLHFNLFDLLHPAHNFDLRDNCPICQFHSYQNNADEVEGSPSNYQKRERDEELILYQNTELENHESTTIYIRGPPRN